MRLVVFALLLSSGCAFVHPYTEKTFTVGVATCTEVVQLWGLHRTRACFVGPGPRATARITHDGAIEIQSTP